MTDPTVNHLRSPAPADQVPGSHTTVDRQSNGSGNPHPRAAGVEHPDMNAQTMQADPVPPDWRQLALQLTTNERFVEVVAEKIQRVSDGRTKAKSVKIEQAAEEESINRQKAIIECIQKDVRAVSIEKVLSRNSYDSSQLSGLVARHADIRGELLVTIGSVAVRNDPQLEARANRVKDSLNNAANTLEAHKPRFAVAVNLLSMAERGLIWLYPPEIVRDKREITTQLLRDLPKPPTAVINLLVEVHDTKPGADQLNRMRDALQQGTTYLQETAYSDLIEDDLQVSRLRKVRQYLFLGILLLLASVYLTATPNVDPAGDVVWPIFDTDLLYPHLAVLLGALSLAAVGAVGGIISGMLRVRDSKARLSQYRTSLLVLSLRPLFGAIAAVTLYLLLSWNTLSSVIVSNPGIYILAAFLAGFSERYFLRILRQEANGSPQAEDRKSAQGINSA